MVNRKHWISLFAVAIIGIVVGSFFDLNISQTIYAENNTLGLAMSAFGCAPVYAGLGAFGMGYFLFALKNKNIFAKIGLIVLALIAVGCGIIYQSDMVIGVNGFNIEEMWYVGYPIGVVITGLGCVLGYFLFKDVATNNKILIAIIIIPCVLLLSILCVDVIKNIMVRPRYRFLVNNASFADFKCWWEQGVILKNEFGDAFSEEFKSFPSGHMATASCIIPTLIYLPYFKNNMMKTQTGLFYIGLVWALLMGLARISVGAHYLSDVSFGLLISSLFAFIGDLIFHRYLKNSLMKDVKTKELEHETN